MKKKINLNTSALILASLVCGGTFEKENCQLEEKRQIKNVLSFDENTIIGQVKSIDLEKSKIKITCTGGSVSEYTVEDSTQIQCNGKITQLRNIEKGAWVMMMPTKDDFLSVERILVKSVRVKHNVHNEAA